MDGLLERVKAATEAEQHDLLYTAAVELLPDPEPFTQAAVDAAQIFAFIASNAYTDAALTLVERVLPGTMRRLQDASDGTGEGEATLVLTSGEVVTGRARTWPLAILAALLSAKSGRIGGVERRT